MFDAEALRLASGLEATASHIARVGRATSLESARWAFLQWELRRRASAKFLRASEMLFDRDSLEMASHERVAAYHASLFPHGALVADMTCGIGSDTLALARRGPVVAYELSADRAEYARHNLDVHGLSADVRVEDSLSAELAAEFAFCDPSRRSEGRRLRTISEFSPDPVEVAERMRSLQLGVIKLSPMLTDRELEALGGRLEFLSFGGECREALVMIGGNRQGRAAVQIESGEVLAAGGDPPGAEAPSRFIFEADPAAIRAHCLGVLCEWHSLWALADSNGYLTGDRDPRSPWLSAYEVLASHGADVKRTRAELRRLGGGTPVVKSRAAADVEALRKQWKGDGEELAVIVYPAGRGIRHAITRRVPTESEA